MIAGMADISFILGGRDTVEGMPGLAALEPFADEVLDLLNDVSRRLMADREAKQYPDVVTFAFWIRKSSALKLKERFCRADGNIHLGRGVAFHIAPSNVPVNFAYSLAAGLLTGNANIVRVPSKEFPQVRIIAGAFAEALRLEKNRKLAGYVCLVRYGREKAVNDLFSSIADTRIIWGGDGTVAEVRKSPLAPRAGEITFADRFSIAVIDSNVYMELNDQERGRIAEGFYNDTYLTDQNACTSPRLVAWMGCGIRIREVKAEFWGRLHQIVKKKYLFQPIQGVNKLTSECLAAVAYEARSRVEAVSGLARMHQRGQDAYEARPRVEALMPEDGSATVIAASTGDICKHGVNASAYGASGVKIESHDDNLLVRVRIPRIVEGLMDLKDNSGYFFEYDCEDILELKPLCDDSRCQTVAYIGDPEMLKPLLMSGIMGIDRVVPVGKTMDFDLIWDGYNLYERLTRVIAVS